MKKHKELKKTATSEGSGLSPSIKSENKGAAHFADQRPEVAIQRKLREGMSENSLNGQSIQLRASMEAGAEKAPIQGAAKQNGLPTQLKSGIEGLSGYSMDDVKVHYNSSKPAQLQAHAYAQGSEIHLAPGQEKHLPHEAWHVVQQKQGRVKATRQLKGKVAINDDSGLEREADVMGAKALQLKKASNSDQILAPTVYAGGASSVVQRNELPENINREEQTEREYDNALSMARYEQEAETQLEADFLLPLLGGRVFLYLPGTSKMPQSAVIYAHGKYSGEMEDAIPGVALNYTGPHDSIANANMDAFSSTIRISANVGQQWHNYNLRIEDSVAAKREDLIGKAAELEKAIAVVMDTTTTIELVKELHKLGINDVFAIHCREVDGGQNVQIDSLTGQPVDLTFEWDRVELNSNEEEKWEYYDMEANDWAGAMVEITQDYDIQVGETLYRTRNGILTQYKVIRVNANPAKITLENES